MGFVPNQELLAEHPLSFWLNSLDEFDDLQCMQFLTPHLSNKEIQSVESIGIKAVDLIRIRDVIDMSKPFSYVKTMTMQKDVGLETLSFEVGSSSSCQSSFETWEDIIVDITAPVHEWKIKNNERFRLSEDWKMYKLDDVEMLEKNRGILFSKVAAGEYSTLLCAQAQRMIIGEDSIEITEGIPWGILFDVLHSNTLGGHGSVFYEDANPHVPSQYLKKGGKEYWTLIAVESDSNLGIEDIKKLRCESEVKLTFCTNPSAIIDAVGSVIYGVNAFQKEIKRFCNAISEPSSYLRDHAGIFWYLQNHEKYHKLLMEWMNESRGEYLRTLDGKFDLREIADAVSVVFANYGLELENTDLLIAEFLFGANVIAEDLPLCRAIAFQYHSERHVCFPTLYQTYWSAKWPQALSRMMELQKLKSFGTNSRKIHLEDHKKNPWGGQILEGTHFFVNYCAWGGQFHRNNLLEGAIVLAINGISMTHLVDDALYEDALQTVQSGKECDIIVCDYPQEYIEMALGRSVHASKYLDGSQWCEGTQFTEDFPIIAQHLNLLLQHDILPSGKFHSQLFESTFTEACIIGDIAYNAKDLEVFFSMTSVWKELYVPETLEEIILRVLQEQGNGIVLNDRVLHFIVEGLGLRPDIDKIEHEGLKAKLTEIIMRGPPSPRDYFSGLSIRFSGRDDEPILVAILRFLLPESFIGFAFETQI